LNERERQRLERREKGDRRTITGLFAFIAGVFVLALIAGVYAIGFDRGQDDAPDGAQPEQPVATQPAPPPSAAPGGDLFAETCGSCHTLAAAGTSGAVGPNLDDLQPDQALVLSTIQNGAGAMPAGLLEGAEAEEVAAYVAANAGR
jgi:mono/diheme cytochrome c family protein